MLSAIVVLPFLSAILMGVMYLFNSNKMKNFYTIVGVGIPFVVTLFSFILLAQMIEDPVIIKSHLFDWISLASFEISVSFFADQLSIVMISFITFIGTLIHIYASGYMSDDECYGKFFTYFNLFMGSMLLLVLADNPIMMFVGWELVGLSSYLLIGFYHKVSSNVGAANKAFIVNRIGDFGFIIGIVLLFVSLEGNGFTFESIHASIGLLDHDTMTLIGILLFVGAMGKSAQIPLYVWLPDAMAGPTPVSALIHAATMVTAGVYMVARFSFLYVEIPNVGLFIATIGILSTLLAAIIASFQNDIKKILAYSTMSQLGYMFVAVGLGAYSSGIFHVFTHAFFKALLFMGAGAVIVALHHEQNIFKMGGLKKDLKLVYFTMFVATLAISGIPPFAGFFSKDAILVHAFASEHYFIWIIGLLSAMLTSFYMFRMFFSVFHSKTKETLHVEEVSNSMLYPLVILAVGSATVGFLGSNEAYGGDMVFNRFLSLPDIANHVSHSNEYLLGLSSVFVSSIGIFMAYKMFAKTANDVTMQKVVHKIIVNKFYVDELYQFLFVKPLFVLSNFIASVLDPKVFDGIINLIVFVYVKFAKQMAMLQNGKVRFYALYIAFGISAISCYMLIKLGELS